MRLLGMRLQPPIRTLSHSHDKLGMCRLGTQLGVIRGLVAFGCFDELSLHILKVVWIYCLAHVFIHNLFWFAVMGRFSIQGIPGDHLTTA